MERLNPRFARRVLLPASYLAFLAGALISAAIFFRSRPFDVKAAVLSDLQSPDDNPQGYAASAVGTAVFAILLTPATIVFHRRLFKQSPRLVRAGSTGFAIGLASALAIGALAPTTHGYTPLHIQLASAAFVGISAGTSLHLVAARASPALLAFQLVALVMLVFLCYGPVEFKNDRLFTCLAFWEWVLCLDCAF